MSTSDKSKLKVGKYLNNKLIYVLPLLAVLLFVMFGVVHADTFFSKWGTSGTGNGQFVSPGYVARDAAGNVYVTDSGNNRIQVFTATGRGASSSIFN